MLNEEILKIVLNDKSFSQREAETIVGGRRRLFRLVEAGIIRCEKRPADRQNGKWYCNAYDCCKNAVYNPRIKTKRKKSKITNHEKNS